jgi:Carboxypeptidase regulatory-like domain
MKYLRIITIGLSCAASLCAQVATGRITGRATDSSAGVIAGATVKSVNILTNVEVSTKTTSDGVFDIPNLIPGEYRLEVDMPGFKRLSQGPIEVRVGDVLTVPLMLQLGAQSESVKVTSDAALLDTSSSVIGQVTDTRRIEDLPLPANNPFVPSMFSVNVTSLVAITSTLDPSANNQVGDVIAAGTLYGQTMLALDGMPNMDETGGQFAGVVPPAEIIQEVKISATPYDASLGHFTGAMINMVTKSGTNGLHGALIFYNTNTDLNALSFFSKISIDNPATGPVTHAKIVSVVPYISYNRYRGVIGGPLIIPKLYNGKNRTFWMYSGDYFYEPYSSNGFYTVPTPAERTGNFSSLLSLGSNYQIYDPYSAVATAGGHLARSPLAGNIIPANKLSPVAQNLLKFYPQPNTVGTATGANNFTGVPNSSIDQADHFGRVDQVITDNDRLFVSYNRSCILALQNRYLGGAGNGIVAPTGAIQNNCHQAVTLDNVFTPAPSWVLHFSYGLIRYRSLNPSTSAGVSLSALGFSPQLISQVPAATGLGPAATLPALSIDGGNITAIGSTSGSQNGEIYHLFFFSANHIVGAHSLKFGVEFRTTAYTAHSYGNLVPTYTFGQSWMTGTDTAAAAPFGQGLASFLYGLPTTGSISRNDSSAELSKMFAWYVQDDWKLSPKVTLNLGFRHELEFPETERFNRANRGFDLTDANPVQAAAQAAYALNPVPQIPVSQFQVLGGQKFVSPSQRGLYGLNALNVMPRVGIAYQVNTNTVVRAGYGIFYESFAADFIQPVQDGFSNTTSIVPTLNNGLSFQSTLDNYPFPQGIQLPTGSSLGLQTFLGKSVTFFNPGNRQAYDQRWSLNIQRQFGSKVLLDIGYTGNRSTHLGTSDAYDSLPIQYLSRSPFRDNTTIANLGAQVANPFANIPAFAGTALATSTIALSQLVLPYPEFTAATTTEGAGYSWYHGISVRAEKRFSHGFTIQGNYTWSKFMEADARLNGIQSPLAQTISSFDRPQQFSPNAIYELPFGRGHHFLSNANGWEERVVGGWQVQTLYEAQSGSPMAFGNVLYNGNLHDIVLPKSQRSISDWFNLSGFNTNSAQQLASNYRTFPLYLTGARNPGINVFALSAIKRIKIREKMDFEVHAEAKNAFNHPSWGGPNLSPTSTLFGQITSVSTGGRVVTFLGKLVW